MSQPAISQHLAVLREARMVTQRQDGRRRLYRVEPKALAPLVDWLSHYREFWSAKLPRLARLLEEIGTASRWITSSRTRPRRCGAR